MEKPKTDPVKQAYDNFTAWGELSSTMDAARVVPEIRIIDFAPILTAAICDVHRAAYSAAGLAYELEAWRKGGSNIDTDRLAGVAERLRDRLRAARISFAIAEGDLLDAQQQAKGSLIIYAGTEYRTAHAAALAFAQAVNAATGVTAEELHRPPDEVWSVIAMRVAEVARPDATEIVEAMKAEARLASRSTASGIQAASPPTTPTTPPATGKNSEADPIISVKDAAKRRGCHETTIRRKAADDRLDVDRLRVSQVDAFKIDAKQQARRKAKSEAKSAAASSRVRQWKCEGCGDVRQSESAPGMHRGCKVAGSLYELMKQC